MNQTPAERLETERKLSENQFDITQYEHVPRRYYGRMFFATLIVIVLAALLRAFANGQIEWSYIGQFLTSEAIIWGLVNTIVMSILAMALGVVIGVITAIMRMSANPILRYVAVTYTWLFRGTPLILQLLLWFNLALIFPTIGIPGLFEMDTVSLMTPFVAALLGLSINQGAYTAEVVRAGLLSVDTGQYEAAKSTFYPQVDAELMQGADNNLDGTRGHVNEWQAMLRMRYNLFAGGSNKADLQSKAYQTNQAMDIRNNALRVLNEDLGLAWNALENARQQLPIAQQYVDYSSRVRESYQKQFSLGDRTLLDLLDSENELFTAARRLEEVRFTELFTQYRIKATMGSLLKSQGVVAPMAAAPLDEIKAQVNLPGLN